MIWLTHKKYTQDYVSEQLNSICRKMRRETRRMVYIASISVTLMATLQILYIVSLLHA